MPSADAPIGTGTPAPDRRTQPHLTSWEPTAAHFAAVLPSSEVLVLCWSRLCDPGLWQD